jgi:hypothetical protein
MNILRDKNNKKALDILLAKISSMGFYLGHSFLKLYFLNQPVPVDNNYQLGRHWNLRFVTKITFPLLFYYFVF